MKTVFRGALAAAFASAAGLSAHAADLPSLKAPPPPPPIFIDSYQPFQVRLKVAGVVPTTGNGTVYDAGAFHPVLAALGVPGGSVGIASGLSAGPGTVIPGSTSTSWAIIPTLDVAYYLTRNWAVEAICCVVPAHIQGTGEIASEFAHTWVFPPSLLVQYHFTNFGAFQPYLGVGVNFTAYWGTRVNGGQTWPLAFAPGSTLAGLGLAGAAAQFTSATVTPSWGVVGQVGFDYMLNEHWGFNLDLKYIQMDPVVHTQIAAFVPGPLSGGCRRDLRPGHRASADRPLGRLRRSDLSLRRRQRGARRRQILIGSASKRKAGPLRPAFLLFGPDITPRSCGIPRRRSCTRRPSPRIRNIAETCRIPSCRRRTSAPPPWREPRCEGNSPRRGFRARGSQR